MNPNIIETVGAAGAGSTALLGQFIRLHHGASDDLPVFRSNAKGIWGDNPRYRFDTYGQLPANYKKWGAKNLGAGGFFGYTDNVNDLVSAIKEMNSNGLSAPICGTLFHECITMGANVVETRDCPDDRDDPPRTPNH